MSNTDLPVSELAEVSSISDSDLLYVVASGASKGIKKQNVLKEVNQTLQTKADLVGGKVPASELPSYVDDVIEGYYNDNDGKFYEDAQYTTEITPETGKIYMDLNTDKSYRWTGSAYLCIGGGLELGETSTTAYRGDRGKTAYDHATDANRSTTAQNLGLYKIGVTSEGHVSNPTAVQASDITGLVDVDKVKQSPDSTNTSYEVLLSGSADNVEHTEYVKKNNKFTHNPSTGDTTIGGLLTDKNGVQSYKALTQAEYDLLPASKNSDGVLYIITDGENPLDVQLWNKVGTASLDTQANDLSNAVNELSASLVNLRDYSSSEVEVGKWIDGTTPVYKKTFSFTTTTSADQTISIGATISKLLNIEGGLNYTSGGWYAPQTYFSTNDQFTVWVTTNNTELKIRSGTINGKDGWVTIYYTK